ncbi:hypothetical protein K8S17_02295, partial [bacterium]|nr:hypothetical protein [bacterium]
MRPTVLMLTLILSLLISTSVLANSVGSSTLEFEGTLTDVGGGIYTGTIDATEGSWYVTGGGGEAISTGGGFDVYAEEGGCAFVEGYYGTGAWNCSGTDTYVIGYGTADPHDGYPDDGTGTPPWGSYWDPDCADY